ncbi:MAG: LysR family transcriptional regulator [Pirellulaceae bacterium]|nr:LysR family transcriptional regulator [Planctomycetales bacterium]
MQLKSLKIFCDVVRQRSFSKAADENGITQSGASQVVQHLEARLGARLIDRSKRPWVLTEEGEIFYRGCRDVVRRYVALESQVRSLHKEVSERVRVASIYSVGLSHMNRYVQEFMSRYPKAHVHVQYQHPANVYELVERDAVELGLVSYPKASREIEAIAWRDEPMVVVCASQHELSRCDMVHPAQLDELKMVGFDPQLMIRRAIDRFLDEWDVEVEMVMEFDNIETIKRAIEINAGIGLLPEPTVAREVQMKSLVSRPLTSGSHDPLLSRPLGIIHRKGVELSTTAQRFVAELIARDQNVTMDGSAGSSSPTTASVVS